ncbi:hypothetical protein [Salinifilum ghardaiensis]
MRFRAFATSVGLVMAGTLTTVCAPVASAVGTAPAPAEPAVGTAPAPAETAAVTPPPQCGPDCERAVDLDLPNSARLVGWRSEDSLSSHLVYYANGARQDATTLEHEVLTDAACGWENDAQRCAITYSTGAHSSGAKSLLLTGNGGIEVTDEITGAAGGAALVSLDRNDRPDVALRQSTMEPNFAEAPQYWETYLEVGGTFARTGCTAPEQEPTAAPNRPAYGVCALM